MAQATPSKTVCSLRLSWCHCAETILGALQFLGNLFEYLLVRKNQGKVGKGARLEAPGLWRYSGADQLADRHHLTVVGATSGDVSFIGAPFIWHRR